MATENRLMVTRGVRGWGWEWAKWVKGVKKYTLSALK